MAQFKNFKPNDSQADVRIILTQNFENAALKPENKVGDIKLQKMIGIAAEGEQQLYYAEDGRDFLSPETGISKNSQSQIINGELTVKKIKVGNEGAKISNSLTIFSDETEENPSFTIDENKDATFYGDIIAKNNLDLNGKLIAKGGIKSVEVKNELGNSIFTNIEVTNTAIIENLKSKNNTFNSITATGNVEVSGRTNLKNELIVDGISTFKNVIKYGTNPGNLNISIVRPMYVGSSAPSSLPFGTLYGQY